MRVLKFLFILVLSVTCSIESYSQSKVRFSDISNLTYQLDCATNQIFCSYKNISQLWKKEFLKTEKDSEIFSEWGKLRKFNSKHINLRDESGNRNSSLNLFEKISIAGLQAHNLDDYLSRLDLLTSPQERAGFERVARHFYPKFTVWWDKEIAQKGATFRLKIKEVLDSEKVSSQISKFIDFYAVALTPNYNTSFNLLFVPDALK